MNSLSVQTFKKREQLFIHYYEETVVRLIRDPEGTFSVILPNDDEITIDLDDEKNKDIKFMILTHGLYAPLCDKKGYEWDVFTNPEDAF